MKGFLIALVAASVALALLLAAAEATKGEGVYDFCDLWFLDCEYCSKQNRCTKIRKGAADDQA